jgi:hypothetical protein
MFVWGPPTSRHSTTAGQSNTVSKVFWWPACCWRGQPKQTRLTRAPSSLEAADCQVGISRRAFKGTNLQAPGIPDQEARSSRNRFPCPTCHDDQNSRGGRRDGAGSLWDLNYWVELERVPHACRGESGPPVPIGANVRCSCHVRGEAGSWLDRRARLCGRSLVGLCVCRLRCHRCMCQPRNGRDRGMLKGWSLPSTASYLGRTGQHLGRSPRRRCAAAGLGMNLVEIGNGARCVRARGPGVVSCRCGTWVRVRPTGNIWAVKVRVASVSSSREEFLAVWRLHSDRDSPVPILKNITLCGRPAASTIQCHHRYVLGGSTSTKDRVDGRWVQGVPEPHTRGES